ncbi:MAG: bacteriohemerythrin [Candidatus Thiodiazotropha endolucinida]
MSLMQWVEEKHGTSVDLCDSQHKELFDRVNALHDAVTSRDQIDIGNRLDNLIDFVVRHFETEERLMEERGYSGLDHHRQEHDLLIKICTNIQDKFHAGEMEIEEGTLTYIKEWLDHHIPIIDKPYGPALSN